MLCDITAILCLPQTYTQHDVIVHVQYTTMSCMCKLYAMPCQHAMHGKAHAHAWHVLTTTQTEYNHRMGTVAPILEVHGASPT